MRPAPGLVLLALCAACASERPAETYSVDGGDHVVVEVLSDGFVRADGRRIPLEALVLELRQAIRRMSVDELRAFSVHLQVAPTAPGSVEEQNVNADVNRLMTEFDIMEVPLVKFL